MTPELESAVLQLKLTYRAGSCQCKGEEGVKVNKDNFFMYALYFYVRRYSDTDR